MQSIYHLLNYKSQIVEFYRCGLLNTTFLILLIVIKGANNSGAHCIQGS